MRPIWIGQQRAAPYFAFRQNRSPRLSKVFAIHNLYTVLHYIYRGVELSIHRIGHTQSGTLANLRPPKAITFLVLCIKQIGKKFSSLARSDQRSDCRPRKQRHCPSHK